MADGKVAAVFRKVATEIMDTTLAVWAGFILFVLVMLGLDLGVFHRKAHAVSVREALVWSVVWVALALMFNLGIYYFRGSDLAMQFLAGYLIEKSLSVDNVFVFALLFGYFRVPAAYQHKVLFWGVLSALLMRAGFIAAGVSLMKHFHGVIYVFGAFLVFTAIKMVVKKDQEFDPSSNWLLKLVRRLMPVSDKYSGDSFLTRIDGKWVATPLFVVLLLVETTDLIFAVDSIPAILAVSSDPFIVFTSNVFAMMGLRSLYFALAGLMKSFAYLHYGLAGILGFVGAKMLLADVYKIPVGVALGVVAAILLVSVLASLGVKVRKDEGEFEVGKNKAIGHS